MSNKQRTSVTSNISEIVMHLIISNLLKILTKTIILMTLQKKIDKFVLHYRGEKIAK